MISVTIVRVMNVMMPIMSAVFCFSLPCGMGIYWVAGAVIRSVEQVIINKHIDKMDLEAEIKNLEAEYQHQLEVKQTMLSHRNISGYHQREKMVDKLEAILDQKRTKRPSEFAAMNFKAVPVERTGRSDRLILKCEDVTKKFDDSDKPLFEDISLVLD